MIHFLAYETYPQESFVGTDHAAGVAGECSLKGFRRWNTISITFTKGDTT